MKFLPFLCVVLFGFIQCSALRAPLNTMDIANCKNVSNNTGRTIIFTFYPFKRTDTYREQESIDYQLDPYDKLVRLCYRGTNLRGIAWQYVDTQQKFFFSDSDELNTRTTYLIQPNGTIEFQG